MIAQLDCAQKVLLEQLHQFRPVFEVDGRLARVCLVKHARYLLLKALILHLNQILLLQREFQFFARDYFVLYTIRLLSGFGEAFSGSFCGKLALLREGHLLGELVRDLHLFELVG